MSVSTLLFLALIIGGIIVLVRHLNRSSGTASVHTDGPERVLAERYARGEIDEQEYQQRLGILRGHIR